MSTAGAEPLPYVAPLIAAERAGAGTGHMHLGYWDSPPGRITPDGWRAAQHRLTGLVLDAAALADGQVIADVACGLGGTLRAISGRVRPGALFGVNIDAAQLALCPGRARLVQGDACALPFAPASLDRMLCIEAAFHFADRAAFLRGAFAALRPGGRLVLADILLGRGALSPRETRDCESLLRRDFGAWPQPWLSPGDLIGMAEFVGFTLLKRIDMSRNTRPSYAVICPDAADGPPRSGAEAMRFLHRAGLLAYSAFVLEKPPSPAAPIGSP